MPAEISADWDHAALFRGVDWWWPDEDVAAGYITHAVRAPEDRLPSPRDWLLAHCGWPAATRRLLELLRELHVAHGYSF